MKLQTLLLTACLLASACATPPRPLGNVIFVIESNPANLDPRYATDGTTQRIDRLLFNGLVVRDNQMKLQGDLAESWETPDPLTYIFHLKPGIHFHDRRPLTSRDVKFTIDYMMDPANRSPKRGSFNMISSIDAPDADTVVFHLKEPYASFLWNMERSAVGIVPAGSGRDFSKNPIGTGKFRFVSQAQDDSVVLTAIPHAANTNNPAAQKVTFRVVPDAIVRALELRKGSADVEMSSLSPDMVPVLAKRKELEVAEEPGTNFAYLGTNLEDPILKKKEVRQALAYAIDRDSLIKYLLRGQAREASGILPPNHWAYEPDVRKYPYDPAHAEQLLDAAGFPRDANGVRMHLTLKVSTQEQARLVASALQDQWKRVGVALEVRPLELATLFSDLDKGNFQLSYSIWIGANNDPDVFDLVFSSKKIPPNGRNRGHYRNPQVDTLIERIRGEMDQSKRKELCSQVQKILSEDLPYVPLWYVDQVSVHTRHLQVQVTPTGDFDFLTNGPNLETRK
jgi:peptide/nickel transport system substrate-binding protein